MLRSRVLALACLAAFGTGPARAEVSKSETPPAAATKILNADAVAAPATEPSSNAVAPKAEPATDTTTKAAEPAAGDAAKPTETAKTAEPAKPAPPPEPTLTASIDLGAQQITVSEHGNRKYTWPISSGTSEHPTPRGTFHPQWTAKMWYSKKYDNAPMPNAVFVSGGVAIHATYATGMLGRPASHGCIRLAPANAATFYKLVGKHGLKMTKVSIYGTPKWQAPAVASRRLDDDSRPRRAAQQQVQVNQGASWFWDTPKYKPTSYEQGYARQAYRRPPPPPGYRYADQVPVRAYRAYGGNRVYYVQQRAPRRYYYGSGW